MCIRLHLEDHGILPLRTETKFNKNDLTSMFKPGAMCKRAVYDDNNKTVQYVKDPDIEAVL